MSKFSFLIYYNSRVVGDLLGPLTGPSDLGVRRHGSPLNADKLGNVSHRLPQSGRCFTSFLTAPTRGLSCRISSLLCPAHTPALHSLTYIMYFILFARHSKDKPPARPLVPAQQFSRSSGVTDNHNSDNRNVMPSQRADTSIIRSSWPRGADAHCLASTGPNHQPTHSNKQTALPLRRAHTPPIRPPVQLTGHTILTL